MWPSPRERARLGRVAKIAVAGRPVRSLPLGSVGTGNPVALGRPQLGPARRRALLPMMTIVLLLVCGVMHAPDAGHGPVAPRALPPERDRRDPRRRQGRRRRGRGGRQDAQPLPRLQDVPGARWAARRAGRSSSKAPRHRQDVHGQGHGPRGRRAVPVRLHLGVPVDVLRPDEPQDPLLLQGAAQGRPQEGGAIGFIEEIDAIGGVAQRHGRVVGQGRHHRRRQRAADPAAVVRHADRGKPDPSAASSTGSTASCPPTASCASQGRRRPTSS